MDEEVDINGLTEALLEPDARLLPPSQLYEEKQEQRQRNRKRKYAASGPKDGERELVAQARRRTERQILNHKKMVQDIKRTQTLRRAMIPRTKMNKSQLRRKKDASRSRSSFRVFRRVEDVHAATLKKLQEDMEAASRREQKDGPQPQRGAAHRGDRPLTLSEATQRLRTYEANYRNWSDARMMSLVRASEDDRREQMQRDREELNRENAQARKEHEARMQLTLRVIGFEVPHARHGHGGGGAGQRGPSAREGAADARPGSPSEGGSSGAPVPGSSSSATDLSGGGGGAAKTKQSKQSTITGYFARRPNACKREVDQMFREFYLERVSETFDFLIQDWPKYKSIQQRQEEELQEERGRRRSQMRCESCGCNMLIDNKHALLTCPQCALCVEGAAEVAYQQTFSESQASVRSAAPYERLAHFKEFIVRLEGAERTEIPEIVINVLLRQCLAHNIDPRREPQKITYHLVRDFLQKTKYAHFFENIPQIMSLLTGLAPMRFTEEEKTKLTQIFREIQQPFQKHKGSRKNFLSYSYTTYKSCELLGIRRFLPLLPLLKAPQNLLAADRIWEKICRECGYEFVRTI